MNSYQRSSIPFWPSAAVVAVCLFAAACGTDPATAKKKAQARADEHLAAGRVAEANIEYLNAVQQDPKAADVREKLAETFLKLGDRKRALQEYVRAADLASDDAKLQLKVGELLLLNGQFDDAKARAERVIAKEPKSVEAEILLANALAGLKDLSAAVQEIEEALQLDPERGQAYASLGTIELARGRREAAEAAFKKAVQLDQKSVPARLSLANFYWIDRQMQLAEKELLETLRIAPEDPMAHRLLANYYMGTSRAPEAGPHLQKVFEITKTPDAALALAEYYISQKDHSAAQSVLQPLTERPETAALAEVRLAAMDRDLGRLHESQQRLDRVLGKDPGNLGALVLKAEVQLGLGQRDEALKTATQAAEKHAESAAAFFALGRVQSARFDTQAAMAAYQTAARLNPRATDAKLEIARLQLVSGAADASVSLAQEAVQAEPQNPNAKLMLVRGLLTRGDLTQAETELTALVARFPNSAAVQTQLGVLGALKKKDLPGARRHFERALALEPKSYEAFAGLVALDLAERRSDAARARLEARLKDDPNSAPLLMTAARAYAGMGDQAQAEMLFRRVIEAEPSYMPAYGALAQLYVSQKRLDAALAEYEEIARRETRSPGPLTFAAIILEGQGKTAEAKDRYERALEIDPSAPVAANNLAWLLAHSGGNLDIALQYAQTAYSKAPQVPEIGDTLGVVLYKKDRVQESIDVLKAAVAKRPDRPAFQFHLGRSYEKVGDHRLARRHLTAALESRVDFPEATEARALLKSLPQ